MCGLGPQKAELVFRWLEGAPETPEKSQKKGQEDQGEVKELWGTPPS